MITDKIIVIVPNDIEQQYMKEALLVDDLNEVENIVIPTKLVIYPAIEKVKTLFREYPIIFTVVGSEKYNELTRHAFIFDDNDYQRFISQ